MANRELKARHELLCAVVREALVQADPIGLVALGCPPDEYDAEVGTIVPRLGTASSETDVRGILLAEFTHWFGADIAARVPERYDVAASAIWAFLESGSASNPALQPTPPSRRG